MYMKNCIIIGELYWLKNRKCLFQQGSGKATEFELSDKCNAIKLDWVIPLFIKSFYKIDVEKTTILCKYGIYDIFYQNNQIKYLFYDNIQYQKKINENKQIT